MNVSERIKIYLVANKITQKELSEKTGIARDKISQSLNNNRKLDTEEFEKIISALGVSADVFIKPVFEDGAS